MEHEITIDRIKKTDADEVAELATQLGYPATPADIERRLAILESENQAAILVARGKAGRAVGFVHVNREHSGLLAEPRAEITALVVDQNLRSQGVGARLLAAAETWARERGFTSVRLRSRVQRTEAHKFYQRNGYEIKKTSYVFVKEL